MLVVRQGPDMGAGGRAWGPPQGAVWAGIGRIRTGMDPVDAPTPDGVDFDSSSSSAPHLLSSHPCDAGGGRVSVGAGLVTPTACATLENGSGKLVRVRADAPHLTAPRAAQHLHPAHWA